MVVLVATLNNKNVPELVKNMNLSEVDTIVVNQSTSGRSETHLEKVEHSTIIYSDRLGLSASRNDAIAQAEDSAICQIADDDLVFVDQYESIVEKAYQEFPDADIIILGMDFRNHPFPKKNLPKGKVGFLKSMRVVSYQINFKKSSIKQVDINFDERFGIGSKYGSGEENIFLFDALKKGLKVYSYPEVIATLLDRPSHWDRKATYSFYKNRGAIFKRMTPNWYWLLIIQFGIRKHDSLFPKISLGESIRYMFQGAREFENSGYSK
ncbi:TPA: glycosyltransferase [Streptococcus suis]|nr:glycosyltransferase [Streptococcus suis]